MGHRFRSSRSDSLFSPVLLGTRNSFRKSLAVFLVLDSIFVGVASTVIWNHYFNPGGQVPYGASSIAISAQAIIFTMSIVGLTQLFSGGPWISTRDPYWRRSLGVIYATLDGNYSVVYPVSGADFRANYTIQLEGPRNCISHRDIFLNCLLCRRTAAESPENRGLKATARSIITAKSSLSNLMNRGNETYMPVLTETKFFS